jgi:hypothetical protein
VQPSEAALPSQSAQLTTVCLHVTIEFPGIVGNLDVDRGEAEVIPVWFTANVHAHLSGMSGHVISSMRPAGQSRYTAARPGPARTGQARAAGLPAAGVPAWLRVAVIAAGPACDAAPAGRLRGLLAWPARGKAPG